jgi:hypothetical protein
MLKDKKQHNTESKQYRCRRTTEGKGRSFHVLLATHSPAIKKSDVDVDIETAEDCREACCQNHCSSQEGSAR